MNNIDVKDFLATGFYYEMMAINELIKQHSDPENKVNMFDQLHYNKINPADFDKLRDILPIKYSLLIDSLEKLFLFIRFYPE